MGREMKQVSYLVTLLPRHIFYHANGMSNFRDTVPTDPIQVDGDCDSLEDLLRREFGEVRSIRREFESLVTNLGPTGSAFSRLR